MTTTLSSFVRSLGAPRLLFLGVLLALWALTVDHLRIEWAVNPQYTYGFAVPFLAAYLIWERWGKRPARQAPSHAHLAKAILVVLVVLFSLARVVEAANPDWRLVSWTLATIAAAATLAALYSCEGAARVRHFAFAACFLLVAVPWPTFLEHGIIQNLTRINVAVTTEALNVAGIAALQHGNVIETARGMVDVDEACSGIRSMQATVMIALFLGEMKQLQPLRRVVLLLGGFTIAFALNVVRTLFLAFIAARHGSAMTEKWHDPAGVAILVGCFGGIWLLNGVLERRQTDRRVRAVVRVDPLPPAAPGRLMMGLPLSLATLLVAGELTIQAWYRTGAGGASTVNWALRFPADRLGFEFVDLPRMTEQFLRCNEGRSARWRNDDGTRWQAFYLRWYPGRTAVHLARSHTPEICLPATGRKLRSISEVKLFDAGALQLPFRCYVSGTLSEPLYVFYSIWEDGRREQQVATERLTRKSRLSAILERRRNPGQRVVQFAITGARTAFEAEQTLQQELPRLIAIAR